MGKLLSLLARDNSDCCGPKSSYDIFLDFENAQPSADELEVYQEINEVLIKSDEILQEIQIYKVSCLFRHLNNDYWVLDTIQNCSLPYKWQQMRDQTMTMRSLYVIKFLLTQWNEQGRDLAKGKSLNGNFMQWKKGNCCVTLQSELVWMNSLT